MPCRIPVLLALTLGLPACRDRAEDVTGGAWLGTPISRMPEGPVVDALLDTPEEQAPTNEVVMAARQPT